MDTKTTTLLGFHLLSVTLEDGTPAELKIRQIRVREYPVAFKHLDDEPALVGFACNQTKQQIENLSPESFEQALKKVKEVNEKGFFTYAGRKLAVMAETLRNATPEMLDKFIAAGKAGSASPTPSPVVPPPAA